MKLNLKNSYIIFQQKNLETVLPSQKLCDTKTSIGLTVYLIDSVPLWNLI